MIVQEYNNILNRNIDDILNKNRNAAQQRTRRINKYMHKYDLANGADCDRLAAQPMKMNVTNGRNEDDSRSIASSRSIVQQSSLEKWDAASSDLSTSSSVIPRCDVKSQPLMCFSSIAYVNANRALQMQQLSVNRRQRPGLSNVLEPLPTATDVSTSGLLFGDPIEHDAPYMFDRVVEQLVNGNGNTFQANEEGAEEEDEDNNEEDEVVEAMERALEEELEANSFEVKLNHHLELLNEISVGSTYEWTSNRPDRLASYIYSPNFLM